MTISLEHIGKRYNYEWVFRKLDFIFETGRRYAILGPNGSGKSTLLQILAGSLTHSEGKIIYTADPQSAPTGKSGIYSGEEVFRHLSLATPYLELIEEFTLLEMLQFHQQFKPFLPGMTLSDIMASVELEQSAHKQIRYFSSGMKQRAKLAQAIFSGAPLLLLDEPCTNLDEAGVNLYHGLLEKYTRDKLVVVSSNDLKEYEQCQIYLRMNEYKSF